MLHWYHDLLSRSMYCCWASYCLTLLLKTAWTDMVLDTGTP
jgi:hypothetical protein